MDYSFLKRENKIDKQRIVLKIKHFYTLIHTKAKFNAMTSRLQNYNFLKTSKSCDV